MIHFKRFKLRLYLPCFFFWKSNWWTTLDHSSSTPVLPFYLVLKLLLWCLWSDYIFFGYVTFFFSLVFIIFRLFRFMYLFFFRLLVICVLLFRKRYFVFFFISFQQSIVDVIASEQLWAMFSSNSKFWGFVPHAKTLIKKYGDTIDLMDLAEYAQSIAGNYSGSWGHEHYFAVITLGAGGSLFFFFFCCILISIIYNNFFRHYFYPLYDYFGVDDEEVDEDNTTEEEWDEDADEEDAPEEEDWDVDYHEEEFFESHAEHKHQEYHLNWYKQNHPLMYWHVLISRLISSKWNNWTLDDSIYHLESEDSFIEDDDDEIETEEWDTEIDFILFLVFFSMLDAYFFYWSREAFEKRKRRIEWLFEAENIRVISAGDMFVLNHSMSNFADFFSDFWNNYIVSTGSHSDLFFGSKEDYLKLHCDNMLLSPEEQLSFSNVFLENEVEAKAQNLLSFEQWALNWHLKSTIAKSYDSTAPPAKFIDINKSQRYTPVVEYKKHRNLVKLLVPRVDATATLYSGNEFNVDQYIIYTGRLQKKLSLFSEDLISRYRWNRKSYWKWMRVRWRNDLDSINNLLEKMWYARRRGKSGFKRRLRRIFRSHFWHSRIYLGDYLMFMQAYRLKSYRRGSGMLNTRKYITSAFYARHPRIYAFGNTYSFFSPDSFSFVHSKLENQYNLDYWNYIRYRMRLVIKHFPKKRRFGRVKYRKIPALIEAPHLIRDFFLRQPKTLMDYYASVNLANAFKPSTLWKLDGYKIKKPWKVYYNDLTGFGRSFGWFILDDSFWYKWPTWMTFLQPIEQTMPTMAMLGFKKVQEWGTGDLVLHIAEHAAIKRTRVWDFHRLYFYEGRHPRFMLNDYYPCWIHKFPRFKFRRVLTQLKRALRRYIFLQGYIDILQSKYGSLIGSFMFHSPGSSLNVLSKTLFNFTIDYSWYEKTHYVYFPDQTFSMKDVNALQMDMYGGLQKPFHLLAEEYDNPLSCLPPAAGTEESNFYSKEIDKAVAVENEIIKSKEYQGTYDYSIGWHGFPFMSSKKWPIADKKQALKLKTIEYAKILNNYRPYSAKNSLVLNFLIDPVGLLLAQRRLYKTTLSLNPTLLPPNSAFFSSFKYFKNFLNVPDFSYLDQRWNMYFFLNHEKQQWYHVVACEEKLEPKEDFLTSFSFFRLNKYYVDRSVSLLPNLYFFKTTSKITENLTINDIMFEDFCGHLTVLDLEKHFLNIEVQWKSWKLLLNKTSIALKSFLKRNDAWTEYLNQKRNIYSQIDQKPNFYVNYLDEVPPFEDFIQDINYSWWDHLQSFVWPKQKAVFSWLDFFEISPPLFEDFTQFPNIEDTYGSWCKKEKELFDKLFEPQMEFWWKKAINPAIRSFKKEINYSAGGSNRWRPYCVEAETWYLGFFTDFFEPYMNERYVTKQYFKKGWFNRVDLDYFNEGNRSAQPELWKNFFGRNDDLHWILMPFISYFPMQAKAEFNPFFPHDGSEFNHILHMDPFVLFHDLLISEFEEETHTKIRWDYEVGLGSDGIPLPYPDSRNVPYRDDEEDDSSVYDEDVMELEDTRLQNRTMTTFWRIQLQSVLNNCIAVSEVDWLTRLVLFLHGVRSDEEGTFHLKKHVIKNTYKLETLDGISLVHKSKKNQICWNQEDLEEGVGTSFTYPLGNHGVWSKRRGWIPVTLGTYKKGLGELYPEDIDREDDCGSDWWYDDLDIWDFWRSELRHGNTIPHLSVDGDFNSYEPSVFHDDFVFYYRIYPHLRVSFTRDRGFFRFFELMEEEDDMDCFEMAWEDEDDVYVYNPYVKSKLGAFVEICPGKAKSFVARVFPTPAWHGYPIPLDEHGWVSISWLWRFSKYNELSFGLEYWGQTKTRLTLKTAWTKGFRSYFADTFGLFAQTYGGRRKRYSLIADFRPKFCRLNYRRHDMRLSRGIGADLTPYFLRFFMNDNTLPDDMEIDDGLLNDDSWDDEEHPMDLYDEGCEFLNDEFPETDESFLIYKNVIPRGRVRLFKNREHTRYDTGPNDGLWEEVPEPDWNFDVNYTATSMAFLKSFDFLKNSYDFNIKLPFLWNPHRIKYNHSELQEYPWRVYNFIGERDLNFNQINSNTEPYMYEDLKYGHSVDKSWLLKWMRYLRFRVVGRGKTTLEDQERHYMPLLKMHARRFPRILSRTLFNASDKTVNLAEFSKDYLYMFLNRKYFPSFIRDEPGSMDALITRYPQLRFAWQKAVVDPFLFKSPVFSWEWWKEGFASRGNPNLVFKQPIIDAGPKSELFLNKARSISGHRAFIPSKAYYHYSTYLRPKEEFSMVREFALDYLMLWQERQRRYTWHFRNFSSNFNGQALLIKQGVLNCKSRFNFSMKRLDMDFKSNTTYLTLSRKTTGPVENLIIQSDMILEKHWFKYWDRSFILYPFVVLSYNINYFNEISLNYQIDLVKWLFLSQVVCKFYSFFIMLVSWALFGLLM